MKGLIVEGVTASGKSSVLREVHCQLTNEFPGASKVFLSEHFTERAVHGREGHGGNGLRTGVIRTHVDTILGNLAVYRTLYENSPFYLRSAKPVLLVTIERFVLTHLSTANHDDDYNLSVGREQLRRLARMGMRQVILRADEITLRQRIEITRRERNDRWRAFLAAKGSIDQVVKFYWQWQERLIKNAELCADVIETEVIDTTARTPRDISCAVLPMLRPISRRSVAVSTTYDGDVHREGRVGEGVVSMAGSWPGSVS